MAMRVERHPLEGAFEALLEHGLDGAGEALRNRSDPRVEARIVGGKKAS